MTQNVKITPEITFTDCEKLKSFFNKTGLLPKACRETGLSAINVRRNLAGPAKGIKLAYVIYLREWIALWEKQEAERKLLAEMVEK